MTCTGQRVILTSRRNLALPGELPSVDWDPLDAGDVGDVIGLDAVDPDVTLCAAAVKM